MSQTLTAPAPPSGAVLGPLRDLSAAVQASVDGIAILGADERYTYVNGAFALVHGFAHGWELLGRSWRDVYDAAEHARLEAVAFPAMTRHGAWRGECTGRRRDGTRFPQEISLTMMEAGGFVCVVRDVTERKAADAAREQLASVLEVTSDIVGMATPDGRMTFLNGAGRRMLGVSETDALPATAVRSFHPAWAQRIVLEEAMPAAVRDGAWHGETAVVGSDGVEVPVSQVVMAHRGPDGEVAYMSTVIRDLRERAATEAALRASVERYRLLFDHNPWPMFVYDPQSMEVLAVNDAAVASYGYSRGEFLAMRIDDFHPPEQCAPLAAYVAALPMARRTTTTFQHRKKDGTIIDVEVTGHALELDGRAVRLALAVDVTARLAAERALRHQAYHDPLTGLANRSLFRERVAEALARAGDDHGRIAVLFLDLDNFKTVNDSLGHAAGDRLLVGVAERLLDATRGSDTVARLGGDEFAVLLATVRDEAAVVIVAERIVRAMQTAIDVGGPHAAVTVGVSIGVARPLGAQSAEDVLRDADAAMYTAKARGKGGVAMFEPGMHVAAVERLALEADLRLATQQLVTQQLTVTGEVPFMLMYQPIVDFATGRALAFEALLRWCHPERGIVPPDAFIPFAEETGVIVPIGRWVVGEACRQLAAWDASGTGAVRMAVNVSGRQLEDDGIVADVAEALRASGIAPDRLTLEVTETAIMRHPARTIAALQALKVLGVRIAVDDFGTGYSSLSYLQQFPVDVLKIDKAFVDEVARGGQDAALARSIVAMGQALGLHTVAEGVELPEQRDALAALGCTLGQGYLFSRPVDAATAAALIDGDART